MEYKMKPAIGACDLHGRAEDAVRFLIKKHYSDPALWAKFVDRFRVRDDAKNAGWRGEYWGKSMRSAVLLYMHAPSDGFYGILTDTARDMISTADELGRVSTYTVETEFKDWDMWCRKYVVLGLEYYLKICRDAGLRKRIIDFLRLVVDYIIDHVGKEEGKLCITKTSAHWRAVNSSSILEPVVRLYRLTDDKKYLDFASYIVENGGADGVNVFELAYKNKIPPYRYGAPKAYELMSCFEGLVEYALVTNSEKYKAAAINFARSLADTDVTVIGSCGVTHELLDHSGARQTAFFDGVSQETCVTVTWMKLCAKMLCLTGDPVFADYMDVSFYNAYLGALNVNDCISDYAREKFIVRNKEKHIVDTILPFDSYSPLIPGYRGRKIGGAQLLSDKSYFGCCACIGGAGAGVYLQNAVTEGEDFLAINFFFDGTQTVRYKGEAVALSMKSTYPAGGDISFSVKSENELRLKIRIPSSVLLRETSKPCSREGGYAVFKCGKNDRIDISFDMPIVSHRPEKWGEDVLWHAEYYSGVICEKKAVQDEKDLDYICFTRGPVVLALDYGKETEADPAVALDERCVENAVISTSYLHDVICRITDKNGKEITLVDYGSAGRDWKSKIAAWIPAEK